MRASYGHRNPVALEHKKSNDFWRIVVNGAGSPLLGLPATAGALVAFEFAPLEDAEPLHELLIIVGVDRYKLHPFILEIRNVTTPPHPAFMSEHTATIFVSPATSAHHYTGSSQPTHVMFLDEGGRAVWSIHNLTDCSAPITYLIPQAPETILSDALLMIGAAITFEPRCIGALMARGFSPGDGRIDLCEGEFLPFDDELLEGGLRNARVGVATSLHSSVGRQIDELTSLCEEVELFLAPPLEGDIIPLRD